MVTIRLLLALTALTAVTILMLRLFWFGNGVLGAMVPSLVVGEAAWIGITFVCLVVWREDHKTRTPNFADALVVAVLVGTVILQLTLPLKMLREFAILIAG